MGAFILAVDDDQLVRESLRWNLERAGHRVITVGSGEAAIEVARRERPDLVVLDVGLPGMDGFETCRRLQAEHDLPVILLTARADEVDRVSGLRLGADDYITKPFSMPELVARVHAVLRRLRRSEPPPAPTLVYGDLQIHVAGREVTKGGRPVHLAPREFDLLVALASRPGQVVRRQHLLDLVWGQDWVGEPKTLDVHIQWLRAKLEEAPSSPRHFITVRGVGYKFMP